MNVPPIDRTPGSLQKSDNARSTLAAYIGLFNFRLKFLAINLASRFPETTVFQFDTNWLFTLALSKPTSFAETSGFEDTTTFCDVYEQ